MWRRLVSVLGLTLYLFAASQPANSQRSSVDPEVARQMRNALAFAEHKDTSRALAAVTLLLREHPAFVPALKLQAMLFEDSGNAQEAAQAYANALKLSPSDPDLLLKVGIVALVQGDATRAISLLGKRATALPRDEEGLYYLAQAYHRSGNDALALKTIRRATELAPNSAPIAQKYGELLCSSGDNAGSLRWLTKAKRADPTLPRIDFDLAVASYNNLDLDQAISYATDETRAQPDDLDAFALVAAARVKLGQWSEAEPILEHILEVRRQDAALLIQLGHCQLELKQNEQAVATLARALQADPTQPLAHFFLSRAYAALGQTAEAHHEADLHQRMVQEISFDPPKAEQQHQADVTDRARRLLAANREDEAVKLFAAENKDPHATPGSAYVFVGATYLSMGRSDAARRAFDHALRLDIRARDAHIYLGILDLQQGDLQQAEQAFDAELALDPNHPAALAELGEVRYRQARWQDAAEEFAKSKTGKPRFLYMLTDCYFHLGNIPAANLTAELLAAQSQKQPEVMDSLADLLSRNGQAALAARLRPR